jgi:hypothetical protein
VKGISLMFILYVRYNHGGALLIEYSAIDHFLLYLLGAGLELGIGEWPDFDTTVLDFGFSFFTGYSLITYIFSGSSLRKAYIFLESQG